MPQLTDEAIAQVIAAHEDRPWGFSQVCVAALRELQAYRAEADDEHPVGVSLRERVAARMEVPHAT